MTEEQLLNKKNPLGKYGNYISLVNFTKIDSILSTPEEFIDKEVLVSGVIIDVCPMRGCWIDIVEVNSDKIIKVKVKDGNIVFPISAKNYNVNVQGIVTKIVYTEEQALNWKIHLGEEKGIKLDKNSIKIDESDLIEYRINGYGAEIF
tara:strand:+ start:1390 stop:1833 length:444 start_codon:yes stop_codon:yes gene_type:complete